MVFNNASRAVFSSSLNAEGSCVGRFVLGAAVSVGDALSVGASGVAVSSASSVGAGVCTLSATCEGVLASSASAKPESMGISWGISITISKNAAVFS